MSAPGPPPTSPFRVALTVDAEFADRPTSDGTTDRLLDVLAELEVPATIFVQGRWAAGQPAVARRVVEDGHLLGNHSHHHARMTLLTGAGIARDVIEAERAIVDATGVSPKPWFRLPFGAGARSPRIARRLASIGYLDVSWHVDSNDWAGGTARRLEGRIVRGTLAHGDGAVILVHGWPAATPDAVKASIPRLRDAGAEFVRVDALPEVPGLRLPAGAAA
ncbi:MAG TPA: polysaccharide deacetylase family protein [Candidatus Limnocylindrales bacterium]|nr:polysaccharide deacetylase family protein [Candidatus Limnocylindrales bacterium]